MIWLSSSTVAALRTQLLSEGTRPSLLPPPLAEPTSSDSAAQAAALEAELGPFAEAMYLMMSADNDVAPEELAVLRGALRNLSGDHIRTHELDALIDAARVRITKGTRKARLAASAAAIATSPARAEVAFVLSAAIAMADGAVADGENAFLESFAQLLGIDDAKMEQLFASVEADLFAKRGAS